MVGGGKPARPGADDQHPPAAADRGRVERPPPLEREIAEEPLDRVNRDGAVQAGPVADALARVVADPAVDRRHRIVRGQLPPRSLVVTGLGVRQPGLDVLPGRAAGVARRQQVDVDGALLADRPGAGPPVQQIRQRRDAVAVDDDQRQPIISFNLAEGAQGLLRVRTHGHPGDVDIAVGDGLQRDVLFRRGVPAEANSATAPAVSTSMTAHRVGVDLVSSTSTFTLRPVASTSSRPEEPMSRPSRPRRRSRHCAGPGDRPRCADRRHARSPGPGPRAGASARQPGRAGPPVPTR